MNKAYDLAREEIGTFEWKDGHNPRVLAYFRDAGHAWVKDDETAWCAAFVGAMLHRAGLKGTGKLTARSYLDWGEPVALDEARPGDIVVFSRGNPNGWQGHVAFLTQGHEKTLEVLGGNQSNQVCIAEYPVSRLLGIRRLPEWVPDAPAATPAPWWFGLLDWLAERFGNGGKHDD